MANIILVLSIPFLFFGAVFAFVEIYEQLVKAYGKYHWITDVYVRFWQILIFLYVILAFINGWIDPLYCARC